MANSIRLAILVLAGGLVLAARSPVIFDTDMGNDVDDALALAMLHTLTSRGECDLIGVTLTNANPNAVPYVRLINRYYQRPDLPVGTALKPLKDGAQDGYLSAVLNSAPAQWRMESVPAETSVRVLRRLLTASSEKVIVIQTGFSTNLAALLDSPPDSISPEAGADLVREKVLFVSAMAGDFSGGRPEYNVRIDVASARAVFERWPTPIIFSGFEIGRDLLYPAAHIASDFGYGEWQPIAASYRAYKKMPYDRPTWDLTAALEAVRPGVYFRYSETGRVDAGTDGETRFTAGAGNRRFLVMDSAKRAQILEALTLLASEPPHAAPAR